MNPVLVVPDSPAEADREAILDALVAFNAARHGPAGHEKVAVLLRHPETGETIGGLWGWIIYDWMFVQLLFVPEAARGQGLGSRLLAEAEAKARVRNCAGLWLDTFAFQAPGFYRRLGFEQFGELPDHPRGQTRYLFRKILAPGR